WSPSLDTLFPYTTLFRSQQVLVPIAAIRWAQAQGDYARIYLEDESYLLRISLAGIEEEWAAYDFVRIYRSHIVNLNFATKIVQRSEEHTSELQSRFDLVC